MKTCELKIEGMRCSMCEAHVLNVIRKCEPNIRKAKASHRKGVVSFQAECVDLDKVAESLGAMGYHVLETKVSG